MNQFRDNLVLKEQKFYDQSGTEIKDIVAMQILVSTVYVFTKGGKVYKGNINEVLESEHPKD